MFPGSSADRAVSPVSPPSSTSVEPASEYRAPSPALLRIVALDDLTAIYHRRSGATHLVHAPIPEMLETMGDRWWTAAALLDALTATFDVVDADRAALAARLAELAAAGLLEER